MSLVYHILDKIPALYKESMAPDYEELAMDLAFSGLLRIDTDYYSNFVRWQDGNVTFTFTEDEVKDAKLMDLSIKKLGKFYAIYGKSLSDKKIKEVTSYAKSEVKKLNLVSEEIRFKIARLIVQSAHPIVTKWILLDRVHVFITYSHNIGDVMDLASWKSSGSNSGMQSTDGVNVAIYVSCGGDPFAENSEDFNLYGDGWPAIARLQVIAAQEMGHFADIIRDKNGNQLGRHAANFSCTRADPIVAKARISDLKECDDMLKLLAKCGYTKLKALERELAFFRKHKVRTWGSMYTYFQYRYYRHKLMHFAKTHKINFIYKFRDDYYIATMIDLMIRDMKMNLAPNADVYKNANPNVEEAIQCVEALARVPQQVMKWGHLTTSIFMKDLYRIYYKQVIPSLIENYNAYAGKKEQAQMPPTEDGWFKKIISFIKAYFIHKSENKLSPKPMREDHSIVSL
jgi:hypothetical protein